jgi:hypothetical protein
MVRHWPASEFLHSLSSQYSTEGVIKQPNLLAEAGSGVLDAFKSYTAHDMRGVMDAGMSLFHMATRDTQEIQNRMIANHTSPADVVRDSFVVFEDGLPQGTSDILERLQRHTN